METHYSRQLEQPLGSELQRHRQRAAPGPGPGGPQSIKVKLEAEIAIYCHLLEDRVHLNLNSAATPCKPAEDHHQHGRICKMAPETKDTELPRQQEQGMI